MKTNSSVPDPGRPEPDFRTFLREELARRCRDNPQYSLRAFAGKLGLDHSSLSQILRGKRTLTEANIRRLASALELPASECERFLALHAACSGGDLASQEFRRLRADVVQAVSDWHHYAILELLHLPSFQADSRWIARVLDIEVDEVNAALARLTRLRLLQMGEAGRWVDLSGDTVASFCEFTEEALRRLSEELGARARAAQEQQPQARSLRRSTTLTLDTGRLPAVRARIESFHGELLELVGEPEDRDEVYQLELHLFPLTNIETQS